MTTATTFNVGGESCDIQDATARSNAEKGVNDAEFARQAEAGIYAGRSLASLFSAEIAGYANVWAWLKARVASANFAGIRIRDYIDIALTDGTAVRYLVGAIDPYYLCADAAKGHHIVMVPSAPVPVNDADYATNGTYIMWNTTSTNQGTAEEPHPYLCSNLHAWETEVYYNALPQAVRDNIMAVHRVLLDERYSAGGALTAPSSWSWADIGPVFSLSEVEVYGQNVWSNAGYATGFDCQLPLFKQTKDRINGSRIPWWLRSVSGSSSSDVCLVTSYGYACYTAATHGWFRPRPCFLVG